MNKHPFFFQEYMGGDRSVNKAIEHIGLFIIIRC